MATSDWGSDRIEFQIIHLKEQSYVHRYRNRT